MSWNKNTIIHSEIDPVIEILKELEASYSLSVLGTVMGHGLNDDYADPTEYDKDGDKYYPIRKLECKNFVILEQIVRTTDCDTDDEIISKKFKKNKVPKNWKLERTIKNS